MDLPRGIAVVGLALRVVGVSTGVGVAAAGAALAGSLAIFIFERTSSTLQRGMRLLLRACTLVLLLAGMGLLEHALFDQVLGLPPFVASVLVIALAVACMRLARSIAAKAAWPGSTRAPRRIGSSSREHGADWQWLAQLVDITEITELQHCVVERLSGVLHAEGAAIFLADATGTRFEATYSTIGRDLLEEQMALPADAPLVVAARKYGEPMGRGPDAAAGRRIKASAFKPLDALGAELVVPLVWRGRLVALVALTRCIDADGYTAAAVERAAAEAELIAVVLENARIYNLALQEKFRADVLLEQLTLGVIAADQSGTIVLCNRAARQLLGAASTLEGRPVVALGDALASFLIPGVAGDEPPAAQEVLFDVKGRGGVPVRVNPATVRGPFDAPSRLIVIEDLSERRALEVELSGAKRLASVGTLAAEMAHEIRNPLVSIKTFSQLLPERLEDRDFQMRFAAIALREVEAIDRIIDRLLNYAGPSGLMRESAEIEPLIREVVELLAPELQERKITVEASFAADEPALILDRDKVRQVLRNVITNAMQAMPEGGHLAITTTTQAGRGAGPSELRVIIRDSGCGIPKAELGRVFDPFYTTRERGFGLGLSLARDVMEEHGGAIGIDSIQGRGTTVTLSFPVVHAATQKTTPFKA